MGEMEREVHAILGPLGVTETLSRLVAVDLRQVEEDVWGDRVDGIDGTEGVVSGGLNGAPKEGPAKRGWFTWGSKAVEPEDGGQAASEDMGLTAFLLKFGEGLGESAGGFYLGIKLMTRGSSPVTAVHLCLDYRLVVLHRRSHPLDPIHDHFLCRNWSHDLVHSYRCHSVHLWCFQDVLHVSRHFTCIYSIILTLSGATGGWGGYAYGAVSTMVVGGLAAGAAFGLVKVLGVKE